MELTPTQRSALADVWRAFDERDVTYVVLRGYRALPESIQGSDLDVLVAEESFGEAVAYCERAFETEEAIHRNALDLAAMVAENPQVVLDDVRRSPREAAATAKRRLVSSDVSGRGYVERSFDAAGLTLDFANHLAYSSPMDGSRIRVDPAVEEATFEHAEERGAFPVPAPPDELAHLVCRGVFDYDGAFPERYVDRCDDLFDDVRSEADDDRRFRGLLSKLFYEAGPLVYDLVERGEYDEIRHRLRRYSDY